eukprot:SAG25_NODE_1218_length_3582_cov_13.521102_3_plen_475_part_00
MFGSNSPTLLPGYEESLPTWWLVFLAAFWVPSRVSGQLIGSVVFPFQVAGLAGKSNKAVAFATANLITQVLSYFAPFIGMASDRHYSRFGRRRPFIVAGQLLQVIGLALMMEASSFAQLAAANALSSFGGMLWNTPYSAVQCDSVPTHQRAITAGMNGFTMNAGALLGSMLGILLGQGYMDQRQAYMLCIVLQLLPIPLGLIATGSKPGMCLSSAGMCSHERPPAPVVPTSSATPTPDCGGCAYARSVRGVVCEFVSAFTESRAFFWLTLSSMLGSVGGLIDGSFRAFWFSDVLAPLGFTVFGVTITTSTVSIISTMGIITSLIRTCFSVFGGFLSARYGPRVLLLIGGLLNAPNPFVFAYTGSMGSHAFTVVFCLAVVDAVYGGLTVGPSGAFMADCLPVGENGQPKNAARDIQLYSLAGSLPALVLPVATGAAFKLFTSEGEAFRVFYLVGGTLSLLTLPMILLINPYKERG